MRYIVFTLQVHLFMQCIIFVLWLFFLLTEYVFWLCVFLGEEFGGVGWRLFFVVECKLVFVILVMFFLNYSTWVRWGYLKID